jgi:hypothetical protein
MPEIVYKSLQILAVLKSPFRKCTVILTKRIIRMMVDWISGRTIRNSNKYAVFFRRRIGKFMRPDSVMEDVTGD